MYLDTAKIKKKCDWVENFSTIIIKVAALFLNEMESRMAAGGSF